MGDNADMIPFTLPSRVTPSVALAKPEDPQSALNAIPKAVLQGARGMCYKHSFLKCGPRAQASLTSFHSHRASSFLSSQSRSVLGRYL